MPRQINRLNARKVETLKKIGRHADGGGLYLSIANDGGRKWVFLYRRNGRLREMGLGSARAVPLGIAREKAAAARLLLSDRIDPLSKRQDEALSPTFNECLEQFLASNEAGWRNEKHASQWRNTLKTYAEPVIGRLSVKEIDTHHVMKILDPIWATKTETASRVRGRIENVLDWASARGYRKGENPARWRGHLDKLLPRRSKVQKVQHHSALPYDEIAEKSPFELSGGQMRRVALAGVLAMRPRILVLDEPTAGLDPRARDFLLNDVRRLHAEGTSVVMISHSMDDVARMATRVAVLEKGRLVMEGSPGEIFARVDRLSAMGLDVPQASRLRYLLAESGIELPECYQLEELADSLAAYLKGGGGHAS